MFDIIVTFEQKEYRARYALVRNEEGVHIYWGVVYLHPVIKFCCIRISGQPPFLAHPVQNKELELALLHGISHTAEICGNAV